VRDFRFIWQTLNSRTALQKTESLELLSQISGLVNCNFICQVALSTLFIMSEIPWIKGLRKCMKIVESSFDLIRFSGFSSLRQTISVSWTWTLSNSSQKSVLSQCAQVVWLDVNELDLFRNPPMSQRPVSKPVYAQKDRGGNKESRNPSTDNIDACRSLVNTRGVPFVSHSTLSWIFMRWQSCADHRLIWYTRNWYMYSPTQNLIST